jgi:hypothetical protein
MEKSSFASYDLSVRGTSVLCVQYITVQKCVLIYEPPLKMRCTKMNCPSPCLRYKCSYSRSSRGELAAGVNDTGGAPGAATPRIFEQIRRPQDTFEWLADVL